MSMLAALIMNHIGRRNTNVIAQVFYIMHYVVLVYLDYQEDSFKFFWLSMFSQLLGALGSGAFMTSTISIVTSLDED